MLAMFLKINFRDKEKWCGHPEVHLKVHGKNDAQNGEGKFTWVSGTTYYGHWKNGTRNGNGVYHYSDNSVYTGTWKRRSLL